MTIPDFIEERVLEILELPKQEQDTALEELYRRHPEHEAVTRNWIQDVKQNEILDGEWDPSAEVSGERYFGSFRLLRQIGRGGMGSVYEAEDPTTFQRIALKVISSKYITSEEAMERFRQEGRLTGTVAHPRCVFVYGADEWEQRPYIVMELMPGRTLKDLVLDQGPLEPSDAIPRVLDVIDGLRAAHQIGIVHRDVKPSNCFVEEGGRVKIGDFGLSKSLVDEAHLTRTGQFLGTVEFASPEQIRGQRVDQRTDVYSTAATLYYLLTARAPIPKDKISDALLKRKVENPIPLRELDPRVPKALNDIVMNALETDRDSRCRNLDDLRTALLPFVPGMVAHARPEVRLGALLIDCALFLPLILLAGTDLVHSVLGSWLEPVHRLLSALLFLVPFLLYFTLCEGWKGSTVGKKLMCLRVGSRAGTDLPGFLRATVRSLSFFSLALVPFLVFDQSLLSQPDAPSWLLPAWLALPLLGGLVLISTMRAGTGYRGLHEVLSDTQVLGLPKERRMSVATTVQEATLPFAKERPSVLPSSIGPYLIRDAVLWLPDKKILLGEDPVLRRKVWIHLRSSEEPPVSVERRSLNRPTRLRWLSGDIEGGRQWDAFVAPSGLPLRKLVTEGRPLPWKEVRPILDQLVAELSGAISDDTLPDSLSVDQVFVQANGRVQLLDTPVGDVRRAVAGTDVRRAVAGTGGHEERCLSFLREVAVLALEAKIRPTSGTPLRAPLPRHAWVILARLNGASGRPLSRIDELERALAETEHLPREVDHVIRAGHITLTLGLFLPGLICMFLFSLLNTRAFLHENSARMLDLRQKLAREQSDSIRQRDSEDLDKLTVALSSRLRSLGWLEQYGLAGEFTESLRALNPESSVTGSDTDLRATPPARAAGSPPGWFANITPQAIVFLIAFWPLIWVLWAGLSKGGLALRKQDITIVRANGRDASGLQCGLRSLCLWLPVTALLVLALGIEAYRPDLYWLSGRIWWAALGLLLLGAALGLVAPTRSYRDRIVGTYLVPK